MDSSTTALITTQSVTFVALLISEIMPFLPTPYQGICQYVLAVLGVISKPKTVPTTPSS